jgi:uncharacterized cupredoxin-like copper-binding protein
MGSLVAACGGGAASPPTPSPTPEPVTVEFRATELSFAPKTVEVPAGRPIRLVLVNDGQIEHNLTIDVLNVEIVTAAGASAEVTVDPIAPGTYELYCSVPGHREAGMTASLVVK